MPHTLGRAAGIAALSIVVAAVFVLLLSKPIAPAQAPVAVQPGDVSVNDPGCPSLPPTPIVIETPDPGAEVRACIYIGSGIAPTTPYVERLGSPVPEPSTTP